MFSLQSQAAEKLSKKWCIPLDQGLGTRCLRKGAGRGVMVGMDLQGTIQAEVTWPLQWMWCAWYFVPFSLHWGTEIWYKILTSAAFLAGSSAIHTNHNSCVTSAPGALSSLRSWKQNWASWSSDQVGSAVGYGHTDKCLWAVAKLETCGMSLSACNCLRTYFGCDSSWMVCVFHGK